MTDKLLHCLIGAAIAFASTGSNQDQPTVELRGAWMTNEDLARLSTRKDIAGAMELLADSGLNAVFPPVRVEADASNRDALAAVLFEAHRRGLEVLPWFDPCGAKEEIVLQAVTGTCQERDLDGVVGLSPFARIRKEVAAIDPELVVVAPARLDVGKEEAPFRLPAVSDKSPEKAGDVLIGLGKLLEKDGELARTLREGPFAEDARLPWRKDRVRRRPASPIEPFAGGGLWTWMSPEGEPRFLAMDGGETGHASWTIEPEETGTYLLYAWIPSREDLAARASYKIASAGSKRTVGIATGDPKNRGWVYLGETRLEAGKSLEVARIEADERDATKITAAGPLFVLRSFRPKPR